MNINTTNFGELEVGSDQVITFENGLPGFEDQKKFVLLNNYDTEDPVPFMWLQATENPDLALVVTIPFFMWPTYEVDVPEMVVQDLGIQKTEDVAVYTVVKIQDKFEDMRVNLMSPIIINAKDHKGQQVILDDTPWGKEELFQRQ